jgi:opacity protein-like surface antigen
MIRGIYVFGVLFLFTSAFEITAQSFPNKMIYGHVSAGLARSEDGLKFLIKQSASQWTPMVNIGAGYRFNKNLGMEILNASMITTLKAEGVLVANGQGAKVTARHSNIVISPVFYFPTSNKSELFIRTGLGFLFSNTSINTASNSKVQKSTSNIGYMVTLGYAHSVSAKLAVTAQFDFSDAYGSNDVWTGDLGLLTIGIRYSLTDKS